MKIILIIGFSIVLVFSSCKEQNMIHLISSSGEIGITSPVTFKGLVIGHVHDVKLENEKFIYLLDITNHEIQLAIDSKFEIIENLISRNSIVVTLGHSDKLIQFDDTLELNPPDPRPKLKLDSLANDIGKTIGKVIQKTTMDQDKLDTLLIELRKVNAYLDSLKVLTE